MNRLACVLCITIGGIAAIACAFGGGKIATVCPESIGPDVIVGDMPGVSNYTATGGLDALSLATYACNVGSASGTLPPPYLNTGELRWWQFINAHPVIALSLYRLQQVNGTWRFEQIGQSWVKHGFFADQDTTPFCCPTCTPSGQGQPGEWLGIGCADLYTASRNGTQGLLGPKSEVNPHTGGFPYPATNPPFTSNGRRLQVALSDLQPSSATVQYFGEAQYVHLDDAAAGNQNNNASYHPLTVTGGPADYTFALSGATARERSAIRAWKDTDPTVVETNVQVPGDGLFIVSYQVTNLGNGWWHYEYAVHNMNVDRAAASFVVPMASCTQLQNIGFHDVAYRDGDGYDTSDTVPINYDGTDWPSTRSASALTWNTQVYAVNPNANALRWGTTYNFRFDANQPPVSASATLGLYKAGSPASMLIALQGPGPGSCPADVAPAGGNHMVNVDDLLTVITHWGSNPTAGDCAPPCGNGVVNVDDLLAVITAWGPCP